MKLWIINAGGKTIWLSRQTHKWAGFLGSPPRIVPNSGGGTCAATSSIENWVTRVVRVCANVSGRYICICRLRLRASNWLTFRRLKPGSPVCHLKPIRFKCLALPLGFSWPYFVPGRELGLSSCLWRAKIAGVQGSALGLRRLSVGLCVCCCFPFPVTARMQWQQLQFVGNVLPSGPGPL